MTYVVSDALGSSVPSVFQHVEADPSELVCLVNASVELADLCSGAIAARVSSSIERHSPWSESVHAAAPWDLRASAELESARTFVGQEELELELAALVR